MRVDYGVDYHDYIVYSHSRLRRKSLLERQDISSAVISAAAVSTGSISAVPTDAISTSVATGVSTISSSSLVVFPSPTATASPSQTVISDGFSYHFINQPILPIPGSDVFHVNGQTFPQDLTLTCQNCTFTGNVTLTAGSFTVSNSSDESTGTLGMIEHGYVRLTADNFLAHIDLNTIWPVEFNKSLDLTLVDVGLSPFTIPGIANVGPILKMQLLLSADIGGTANLTYGFEVVVPNNSTAIANFENITASSITGFKDTTLSTLPFDASISDIALNLSADIKTQVLVGIDLFDGYATAGAGVFLDLPSLSLSVEEVNNRDENCNPTTNRTLIQQLDSEYDAMINIIPDVVIDAGLVVQAELGKGDLSVGTQTAFTPLSTAYPPPTACFAFDKNSHRFVSPTLPPPTGVQRAGGTGPAGSSSSSSASTTGLRYSQMVVDVAVTNALIVGALMMIGSLLIF